MNAKALPATWLPLAWMGFLFTTLTFTVLRGLNVDLRGIASALSITSVWILSLLVYKIWTLAAIVILLSLLRGKGMNLAAVGLQGSLSFKAIGYAGAGALLAIFLWPPVEAFVRALGANMFWRAGSGNLPWGIHTSVDGILLFLSAVVFAPVLEEIVFRGYVLTMLSQRTGSAPVALILSSLIFASVHYSFGPGVMVYVFLWAFIPSLLYLKFKNLYPGMLMHSLSNLWAYVLLPLILATRGV
ncbi:MAG: lysostaphin resistance A-like protein [Armatimonadota bacterium]